MRKIVALVILVGLVVLAFVGTQNGWFAGTDPTNPAAPKPAASAPADSTPADSAPATDSGHSADAIPSDATEAVVEYVHDGDTLFLTDGRKVRMLGINTPEIGDNLECYGDEATALLRSLLPEGTHVWVEQDVEPLDQYGRSLLFVYTNDGTNVNLELLREGAAEVEMYRPNVLFRDEIYAAEDSARASNLGLWGACN